MYEPTTGRWLSEDPVEFLGGDVNLYRYVGNAPTNATDPTGLWTWRLGPKGEVFAESEKGNSVQDLINQGYDKNKVTVLAQMVGLKQVNQKLAAGRVIDLTSLLPAAAQQAIRDQQIMNYEKLRARVENSMRRPPNVPKNTSLGASGVDLAQQAIEDDRSGLILQVEIADNLLGLGNCYGFVGLLLGLTPPKGLDPRNYSLGPVKGADEKYFRDGHQAPGVSHYTLGDVKAAYEYLKGGLHSFFTSKRKVTLTPLFGAVAIFKYDEKVQTTHAAFVLGRSNDGTPFLLHKLNSAKGIVITSAKHAALTGYGKATYYQ